MSRTNQRNVENFCYITFHCECQFIKKLTRLEIIFFILYQKLWLGLLLWNLILKFSQVISLFLTRKWLLWLMFWLWLTIYIYCMKFDIFLQCQLFVVVFVMIEQVEIFHLRRRVKQSNNLAMFLCWSSPFALLCMTSTVCV